MIECSDYRTQGRRETERYASVDVSRDTGKHQGEIRARTATRLSFSLLPFRYIPAGAAQRSTHTNHDQTEKYRREGIGTL